jgi:hypothetical protein
MLGQETLACLTLKRMHLSCIGDIDRTNVEIECHISTNPHILPRSEFSCGLFTFDLTKNDDRDLDISIPCKLGENVIIRLYERDNCNDDTAAFIIQCTATGFNVASINVDISADDTTTEYSKCRQFSNAVSTCGTAQTGSGQSGGSFCYEYQWGEEECGSVGVKESTSQYWMEYEVVEGECSSEQVAVTEVVCPPKFTSYIPGPICSSVTQCPHQWW